MKKNTDSYTTKARYKELKTTAKEIGKTRRKVESKAKQLKATAKKKVGVKAKVAKTAKELKATAGEIGKTKVEVEKTAEKLKATTKEKEKTIVKLRKSATRKERVRFRLAEVAKQLAATAKDKEETRIKLEKTVAIIKELSDRNEAILSSIGEAALACDKKGQILLFNKMAEEITGISKKEAIGTHLSKIVNFINEKTGKPTVDFISEAINKKKRTSPWFTAPANTAQGVHKALKKSFYRAYAGSCTWLNGVFWVKTLQKISNEIIINNLTDMGDISVQNIHRRIESDLIYPLLRNSEIDRWIYHINYELLMTQNPITRKGVDSDEMRRKYPETFMYLKLFESALLNRSGYKKYFKSSDPFWSIYNVGTYTLAPIKVVWRQFIPSLKMVVIEPFNHNLLGNKVIIPQHTVSFVPFETIDEAHYFCAVGNSTISTFIHKNYSTSKSYGSPHVLEYINIPKFDRRKKYHIELSELSKQAHQEALLGNFGKLREIEEQIDITTAALWEITDEEFNNIKDALK